RPLGQTRRPNPPGHPPHPPLDKPTYGTTVPPRNPLGGVQQRPSGPGGHTKAPDAVWAALRRDGVRLDGVHLAWAAPIRPRSLWPRSIGLGLLVSAVSIWSSWRGGGACVGPSTWGWRG